MTAFEWGMFGLWVFFTLVFVWSLYSYKANQTMSEEDQKPRN